MVGRGLGRGWPCVTQGLACVTGTAETAETAGRYAFLGPNERTQPMSTKRNPNFGRTLAFELFEINRGSRTEARSYRLVP